MGSDERMVWGESRSVYVDGYVWFFVLCRGWMIMKLVVACRCYLVRRC